MKLREEEIYLKGTPVSRGIAIGQPYLLQGGTPVVTDFSISPEQVVIEVERFREALSLAEEDLIGLQLKLEKQGIAEGVAVLDAQLQMIRDPLLVMQVEKMIGSCQRNAEAVLDMTVREYQEKFNAISDQMFRERFKDLQDISRRILGCLKANLKKEREGIEVNSIMFALDLVVSDVIELDSGQIGALVIAADSDTSHAAIVAKAKGIPYVGGVPIDEKLLSQVLQVIVDGRTGEVILNPTQETLTHYQFLQQRLKVHLRRLEHAVKLDPQTYDGYEVRLSGNVESLTELEMIHQYGGSGIGLFRSEHLFLARDDFPHEEEQFIVYRQLVERMRGLPIVIRTFDIGGDKLFNNKQFPYKRSVPLANRAIRFLLKNPEIFKSQLRAIARASAYGQVKVLIPMVSGLFEVMQTKAIIQEVQKELEERGEKNLEKLPLGCMVEVPSAALTADLLAQHADFLSIGTNDLVQYALAIDRGSSSNGLNYTCIHPGVLRLIKLCASQALRFHTPVSICGEMAADPRYTALLLGLGIQELSVAPRHIPVIKHAIRHTSMSHAIKLADQVMSLSSAEEIDLLLNEEYRKMAPDDFCYNVDD